MPATANFYEVLRVSPDATAAEIKAAFRARAKATHPDLQVDAADADASEFKLVQRAYEALRDRGSRAAYDASLRAEKRAPGSGGMTDFAEAWAWRAACVPRGAACTWLRALSVAASQERGGDGGAARTARGGAATTRRGGCRLVGHREGGGGAHAVRARVECRVSRAARLSGAGYTRRRRVFRLERARAAGASDSRKAATLSKWWHTRRGLQWQDAVVLGVTASALLYAAEALKRGSRRRAAALAEPAPPADAPT
jgi:curved DNA-binding protein CbpA